MSEYFFQITLALGGAVIGIVAAIVRKRRRKSIFWILSISLIVVAAAWFFYELGQEPGISEAIMTVHVADNEGLPIPNAKVLIFFSQGSFSGSTPINRGG